MNLAPTLVSQLKELAEQTNTKTPVAIDRENCVGIIQAIAYNTKQKAITKLNDCLVSIRLELEKTNDAHAAEFAALIQFVDFNNLDEVRQLRDFIDQVLFDTEVDLRVAKWEDRYLPFFMDRLNEGRNEAKDGNDPMDIEGQEAAKDSKKSKASLFSEKTPKEIALGKKKQVLKMNKDIIDRLFRGLVKLQQEVEPLCVKAADRKRVQEWDHIPTSPVKRPKI